MLSVLILCAAASATAQVNLPIYHVNPLHEGVLPIDSAHAAHSQSLSLHLAKRINHVAHATFTVDTADLAGDAFFDLRSKVLPIECAANTSFSGDCNNGEVIDNDLVISKLTLEVKVPHFGEYSRCNICLKSGRDPLSNLPCTPGEYICTCGSFFHARDCTNETSVGAQNITKAYGSFSSYLCNWERWIKEPWMCWSWPIVGKTGGMWYSTTRAGWCGAPGADPRHCTWDAKVEKVINKTCSDGSARARATRTRIHTRAHAPQRTVMATADDAHRSPAGGSPRAQSSTTSLRSTTAPRGAAASTRAPRVGGTRCDRATCPTPAGSTAVRANPRALLLCRARATPCARDTPVPNACQRIAACGAAYTVPSARVRCAPPLAVASCADYATLLGASHLLPSGSTPRDAGMPRAAILDAFAQPFLPEADGGCPDIAPPAEVVRARALAPRRPAVGRPWRQRERIAAALDREAATLEVAVPLQTAV